MMIDLNKVGYAVSVCRREKGFTQDELASRLGVTPQAVSKWERGLSLPDTDMLPDISRILEVSIDDLLSGILPSQTDMHISSGQNTPAAPAHAVEYLLPDEIAIEISPDLCLASSTLCDGLIAGIKKMRDDLAKEYGILLPVVRIRDDDALSERDYRIRFRNKVFGSRKGSAGHLSHNHGEKIILSHLFDLIFEYPDWIITRQMIKAIVENLSLRHHVLISEVVPVRVNYGRLRRTLIKLIRQKKPINDMVSLLEFIDELMEKGLEEDELVQELVTML